jgi:hypothetical protein
LAQGLQLGAGTLLSERAGLLGRRQLQVRAGAQLVDLALGKGAGVEAKQRHQELFDADPGRNLFEG